MSQSRERSDTRLSAVAEALLAEISGYGHTLVAFSGGADSALVLAAAVRALGPDLVAAMTAVSPAVPDSEVAGARTFATGLGVAHFTPPTSELAVEGYRRNGPRRCHFCKTELMTVANRLGRSLGVQTIATGTNADDVLDGFRPGVRAAARLGARTPLANTGIDKTTVRAISRWWRLPTWDKPALACLSSRIAYGLEITPIRLARVGRAEAALRAGIEAAGLKLRDLRVRDLGDRVRIEVDAALVAEAPAAVPIAELLRNAGFPDMPFEVQRFRSGSMNEALLRLP